MALSQLQCLDDNHVNWRINETKPEFLYSEEQRLALEALISGGRHAFLTYVRERELRPFLSERELERLGCAAEDYRPGREPPRPELDDEDEGGEGGGEGSLQYWPERSDTSIPDLSLGWPDINSYRGVTRVHVYTQPPMDGQTHIKEVVRKAIVQAQKIIAVVMDVFTDVDIFKDLLDAGFKRKVAVYIIIEQSSVQDFLHMCERAGMHGGHLKYLRVRCNGGSMFHTRSAKKVQGSMCQKFMFVDGDRAISGSYSFTWTSSRLDRNLVTVLTGQAVDAFDKQFRELYVTSRGVNLSRVPLGDVPEPEPLPPAPTAAPPTPAIARKLINPKYSLVDTAGKGSSDNAGAARDAGSQGALPVPPKRRRGFVEEPPKHPGLVGLPKAELIPYLPTWPEPDPPSDVIGFINIRDTSKPLQPHLMRSQMFEASQAIRFKDPFTAPPEEPLPERARPRRAGDGPDTNPLNSYIKGDAHAEVGPAPDVRSSESEPGAAPPDPPLDPTPDTPIPKPRAVQLVVTAPDGPHDVGVSLVPKEQEAVQEAPEEQRRDSSSAPCSTGVEAERDHAPCSIASAPCSTGSVVTERDHGPCSVDSAPCSVGSVGAERDPGSSDEYYECSDSDRLANGRMGGSGHLEKPGPLNVMSRFSRSLVDLRPENGLEPGHAHAGLLPHAPDRQAGKVFQTHSRFQGQEIYSRASRVVIAKPGAFHLPTKRSALVIGGHRYWSDRLNVPPPPDDARNNCRRSSNHGLGGGLRPGPAHRLSDGRAETHTPLGLSVSKLASLGNFRNSKRVAYGHKKS